MTDKVTEEGTHWLDITVITLYLLGTLAVGIWTIVTSNGDLKNVFLAGRSMTWWPVGMSLFASNIGAQTFVGVAGSGVVSGVAVVMFEWNAVFLVLLLGWVFLPVYIASGIYTMPEYLQERFGGLRIRVYLSIVQLITYVFATVSADLYIGSLFLQETLGWDLYVGVAVLLLLVVVFTGLGGLKTVILTDSLAVFIMVIGGFILCIVGFVQIGGYTALQFKYMRAVPGTTLNNPNTTCGYPREDAFHIFRHWWDADYPWLGTMLRTLLGGLWYWCANQVLVQRALSSRNVSHAKAGAILAAYLKLTPMFLMVFPGMISRALFTDEVACADPDACEEICGIRAGCSSIAYPKLVMQLLPAGIRGLLISSIIAAVISSLTSVFNSSSTLFTMDIWSKIRTKATERELLLAGRLFVACLTAFSIVWIPVLTNAEGGEIFRFTTTMTGYFGAPTCAMFILAIFWKRCNEQGAFWGMLIAQCWGLVRFIMDNIHSAPLCGEEDTRPSFVKDFHAYYFNFTQILLAFVSAFLISILTQPEPDWRLPGLTWWTKSEKPMRDIKLEKKIKEEEAKCQLSACETSDGLSVTTTQPTLCQRFLSAVIGSKEKVDHDVANEPSESHAARLNSLQQPRTRSRLMNANAISVMVITVFLYGFFY